MATETKTFHTETHEGFTGAGSVLNASYPVGTPPNTTEAAYWNLKTGSFAETYIYWPFDLSAIPEDATIDSVSCRAAAWVSTINTSYIQNAFMQLFSGSTAKGSETSFKTQAGTVYDLTTGDWTRAELSSCRLRLYARRGNSKTSNTYYAYFGGADLTVQYTYQGEKFMLKLGGAWHDIARVFKKVNDIWVEQEELANVVDQTKRLVNGGEYVVELPEGYTRLEYIESTGSQHIDTGFKPNQDTRVVCDIFASAPPASNFVPYGQRTSGTSDYYYPISSNGGWAYCFGTKLTESSVGINGRQRLDSNKNALYVNGKEIVVANNQFSATYPIFLFALNQAGTASFYSSYMLYSCKIYDNGVLVRDFIPAINPYGVVCLYDRVSETAYVSGSGYDLVAGPVFSGGGDTGGGSAPSGTIAFTINGTNYQAEPGMTWGEWVASNYNTSTFAEQAGRISVAAGIFSYISTSDGANVKTTDTIVSSYAYITGGYA